MSIDTTESRLAVALTRMPLFPLPNVVLFPHASLAEGIAADLDPASHFLIRLRIWHPMLAVATSLVAVFSFRSMLVTTLVLAQAGLGVMNLLMLAPLPLQMAHLLGSSVLWIAMVWEWMGADAEMT